MKERKGPLQRVETIHAMRVSAALGEKERRVRNVHLGTHTIPAPTRTSVHKNVGARDCIPGIKRT